jgi:Zn-finger nucleic acid-binding protein
MKCPVCNVDLLMDERQSVGIDYCPRCRGVWLDRGELDKIIERANAEYARIVTRPQHAALREEPIRSEPDRRHDDDEWRGERERPDEHGSLEHRDEHAGPAPKTRSSFLGDLLDGFGGWVTSAALQPSAGTPSGERTG